MIKITLSHILQIWINLIDSRPLLVTAVKRAATAILDKGGFIRTLEYIGDKQLPSRTYINNIGHERGQYFILKVSFQFRLKLKTSSTHTSFSLLVIIKSNFKNLINLFWNPICFLKNWKKYWKKPATKNIKIHIN